MTDNIELVRGSGNVFRDFGDDNADLEQLKSILAAKIIGVLDDQAISVRKAHAMTGIAAADFSRIRNAKLGRFTVDRLMTTLSRLDQQVKVQVSVRPLPRPASAAPRAPWRARHGDKTTKFQSSRVRTHSQ
jgi:predicted XRE-type DNA-binding protein